MKNIIVEEVAGGPKLFSEFLRANDLKLRVVERSISSMESFKTPRWFASTEAEILGDSVLIGSSGNGNTIKEAIEDYKRQIKGRVLVLKPFGPKRCEIRCPNEWLVEEYE